MILLVGNWKMAPEKSAEALKLAKFTNSLARTYKKQLSLVVCPPLPYVTLASKNATIAKVGAQTVSPHTEIAHTGEVGAGMLKASGVAYCIVGHSEMRAAGDTNERVREQTRRLLEKKITPIVCVGEQERDAQGWYLSAVKEQIESVFAGIPKATLKNTVIAYEPVWAIGKNAERTATAHECHEMVIYIRKVLRDLFDEKTSNLPKILYGGSVDEKNAKNFIVEGKAEGLLVGRVSLESKRFAALAQSLAK